MSADAEGFTEFEVSATLSDKVGQQLVSHTTRVSYGFGRAVTATDMVAPHEEASRLARELAERELEQQLAKVKAQRQQPPPPPAAAPQPAVPPPQQPPPAPAQAPVPAAPVPQQAAPQPQAVPAQGRPLSVGQKPRGAGQVRYVPSNVLSTDQFKEEIAAAIRAEGDNPDQFKLWDNRVGANGLESGNANWSVAGVKPVEGTPAHGQLGNRSAYWVDFDDNGAVTVKATKDYKQHLEVQQQVQAQLAQQQAAQQAPQAQQSPVPF